MAHDVNPPPTHTIILGGGLAGSFLGMRLALAGQAVTLIDDRFPSSASRVAAGLFNVITGRFGAKSWLAEDLLKEISQLYHDPAWSMIRPSLHYGPIYRPFKTIEAYNKWTGRQHDPTFAPLVTFHEQPLIPDQLHNELGGIMIQPCGWADTAGLIETLHRSLDLMPDCQVIEDEVSYETLDLAQRRLMVGETRLDFDMLVFAEGYRMIHNPYLDFLPLIPNKGEILLIEAPALSLPFSLSRKIYLIELAPAQFVVGSTYQNQFSTPDPTAAGRQEIEQYLQQAIRVPYRILDQRAGIRPTTPNRRPIVGRHPGFEHVYVLGGFGTKGMLLGPSCSKWLVELMLKDNSQIPLEADLARYVDLV